MKQEHPERPRRRHMAARCLISVSLLVGTSALMMGCQSGTGVPEETASTEPGLRVGERAPDATLLNIDGQPVRLASLYDDGPIVLTFYRGGWCPYCTRALSGWHDRMDEVRAAGGTFVALTPESPDKAEATRDEVNGEYLVLSDVNHDASRAFRVHFNVDPDTRSLYENRYDIHVDRYNASKTWELPAPATFVIDRNGIVRWAFADWDYTKRANVDEVIAALRAL